MSWRDQLLEEGDFWQVYTKAKSVVGNKFNNRLTLMFFISSTVLVFGWSALPLPMIETPILIGWVRHWAALGVGFTTSLLGFLIAGFSIFATLTNKNIFKTLAKIPYKKNGVESQLSQFKFIFFNFIMIFLHYLSFMIFCLTIVLFFPENGMITIPLGLVTADYPIAQNIITSIGVVVTSTWFVLTALMLKSFIWNLYQSVLLAIVLEEIIPNNVNEK